MSEHSSKPHKFVPTFLHDWCGEGLGVENACAKPKLDPIHAQAEPKPVEIAEKRWREWWNLCKDGSTDNMNIRKNSLKALIEELSQAQPRIKELEEETQR